MLSLWLCGWIDISWAFLLKVSCMVEVNVSWIWSYLKAQWTRCLGWLTLVTGSWCWALARAVDQSTTTWPLQGPWASHDMAGRRRSITRACVPGGRKEMFLGQVRATPGTGTVTLGSHSICLSSHRAWQDLRPWINKHLFMGVWQGCTAKSMWAGRYNWGNPWKIEPIILLCKHNS